MPADPTLAEFTKLLLTENIWIHFNINNTVLITDNSRIRCLSLRAKCRYLPIMLKTKSVSVAEIM